MNLSTKRHIFVCLPLTFTKHLIYEKKKKKTVQITSSLLTTEVSVNDKTVKAIASKGNKLYGILSKSNGWRLKFENAANCCHAKLVSRKTT